MAFVIRALERKIRRELSDGDMSASRHVPERLERKYDERGPGNVPHRRRKGTGGLQHHREQRDRKDGINCRGDARDFQQLSENGFGFRADQGFVHTPYDLDSAGLRLQPFRAIALP